MAHLRAELETQKALVSALLTRIYGAKSEKMSHDQLLLAFLEEETKKPEAADGNEEPPAAKMTKPKRTKRTNKLLNSLEGLPTIERTITDPEVLANPEDFRLLSEEVSVRLHASPATFTREIIKRQTHVRKNDPDAIPFTPPLEPCLLPGSVLTPSLGALLLTEKFCYHQPFYRQQWRLFASHGIEITRNNMCIWHDHLADLLLPLYQRIATNLRQASYLKVDETPIACLEPGKGRTATGYFWVYHHPEHGPFFDWHKSRANTCLDRVLIAPDGEQSFSGYLQSDGLRAYRTFIERFPDLAIIAVACLAHIRRKFFEAKEDHPRIAAWILYQMGKIYAIERRLKAKGFTPLERQQARWEQTRRHYEHLQKLFQHLQKTRRILPKSKLGKALSYALDQWKHLEPCFHDGQIEFDNNHTEGAIRPTKLGAKNWTFIGGEETGWRSAVIYTFVEQIRRHNLDPHAYLEWVFEKLMHKPAEDELEALLPVNWVAAQRSASNLQSSAA
ncbi:MAG: IS66 family transposase [Akkermansiaceae bacterium]